MPPVEFKFSKVFDNTRRVSFPEPPSWAELANKIYELYDVPARNVGVSYVDHDGDEITISSDQEIKDFYATSLVPGVAIKLTVHDLGARNAQQAKELPDTPRMSTGTFGPGNGMPFMFSEIEDGWQRIPGLGFGAGQRPLSFASSDGPHAFVETIPSDASVHTRDDRDDVSSTMDTDLGEIIEPTIAVSKDKGKGVDRGAAKDIDSAISLLAEEEPVKIPVHAMPAVESTPVHIPRAPQSALSEGTAIPHEGIPKPTLDTTAYQPSVTPNPESVVEAVSPSPSTSNASLYNDIATLLTTAAAIFTQHPELGEGLRNIVNNAMNGAYINGAPETIARVAEDFRRRAQGAQFDVNLSTPAAGSGVDNGQADAMRDAAEAQRAAGAAEAEAMRSAAEAERAAHVAQAEVMRKAAEAERAAHEAQAEVHRTAAQAMREAHRAEAEAHQALREAHRAAAEAHRGAFEVQRSAVELRRAADDEAGRRVADAVGNIFRAFAGPNGSGDGQGEHPVNADTARQSPFYSIPLQANESDARRSSNPFRALGQAGAILNQFMPPGGPLGQASSARTPSLRRQERERTFSQSGAPRQAGSNPAPPVHVPPNVPRSTAPSRPRHPPAPPVPPVGPAPPAAPVAPTTLQPTIPIGRSPVRPPAPTVPAAVAAATAAQQRSAKEQLDAAKRQYKEAKEQYRRDREERYRRGENVSGDSALRSANNSQDPQNASTSRPLPASAQPTPMTDVSALPSNTSQVISTGRGRFPPLEMISAGDPRRTSLHANGSIRRSGSRREPSTASTVTAGPSSPSVRVKRKLADMGFSEAVYPSLPSMIEAQLATHSTPSRSDEDEVVARLLEELLAFSPPSNSHRRL